MRKSYEKGFKVNTNKGRRTLYSIILLIFFIPTIANCETVTCGLKKVFISGNKITKIIHEDGTVHSGSSVSDNWKYDGKSIKHRYGKLISCGGKPKSRTEVIAELSERFAKAPDLYGLTKQEGLLMKDYTANLMKSDNECHLLVDAAKSTSRQGMYFVDCNDKKSKTKRFWVSESELKQGVVKSSTSPISSSDAIKICNQELKSRTNQPDTYNPSLTIGTTSRIVERTGRNVVEIEFEASNALGMKKEYIGQCILEGGKPLEVTIRYN